MTPGLEAPMAPSAYEAPRARPRSYEVELGDIQFRRLRAGDEIQALQKLRAEIQLPGAALADPGFLTREKKETGRGSSASSSGKRSSSAR
jgi:hypothetical protein